MTSNAAQLQKELSSVEQTNALLESIAEFCRSGQIDTNDLSRNWWWKLLSGNQLQIK